MIDYAMRVDAIEAMMTGAALDKYHRCYHNPSYIAATEGKSVQYANALIDEAMALCGHPRYKLSFRRWSSDALAHLANFTD